MSIRTSFIHHTPTLHPSYVPLLPFPQEVAGPSPDERGGDHLLKGEVERLKTVVEEVGVAFFPEDVEVAACFGVMLAHT